MKVWSFILGTIALCLSIFAAASYHNARRNIHIAAQSENKFRDEAQQWATADTLRQANERSELRTDRLKLQNALISQNIAELEGHGMAKAIREEAEARELIRLDEQMLRFSYFISGPGPEERSATERADAARASGTHYMDIAHRDIQLAYGCGVLWLAFGFAAAVCYRGMA